MRRFAFGNNGSRRLVAASSCFGGAIALAVVCAGVASADPPPARASAVSGTLVMWRILDVRSLEGGGFTSRVEVFARTADGGEQRVAALRLPCSVSNADDTLTCAYGGAFDYLRIRRAGRVCVIEAQRTTEHGMGARRNLGRFRCVAPITERVEALRTP